MLSRQKNFFLQISGIILRVFSVIINCQRLPERRILRLCKNLEEDENGSLSSKVHFEIGTVKIPKMA